MTDFGNEQYSDQSIQVHIGDQEWADCSYESKLRLLYRLRQSKHALAKELEKSLSLLIEDEQKQKEIDFESTFKKIYGDGE